MSAEKYVDSVVRKVRCGREKKKEIRQQLLSDITAAREEGESLESIIGRIGSGAEAVSQRKTVEDIRLHRSRACVAFERNLLVSAEDIRAFEGRIF